MRTPAKSFLEETELLYQSRSLRTRQQKSEGARAVGYFCCYVPNEIFTALDVVSFRIHGDVHETTTAADVHLETCACPFARSSFDLALKGRFDFLDGVVMPHSCDTIQRLSDIWREQCRSDYFHFLDVPHMTDSSSETFFREELECLGKSLEKLTGRRLTNEGLRSAIALQNTNRALLRELYSLRKPDPPLISGTEVTKLLIAGMGLPVREYNDVIRGVIDEVGSRPVEPVKKPARILLYGTEVDDVTFVQVIEQSGANVVIDDTCTGTRPFWTDVDATLPPWEALAKRYLQGIPCPRTYRPKGKDRAADLEQRFSHIRDFLRDFNVNGVILNTMMYCDSTELEAPDIIDYVTSLGIPALHLEDTYSGSGTGQLQSRVQAFVEMIEFD